MALPPQKFREIVFQLLYSSDLGFSQEKDIVELLMGELEVSKKNVLIAQEHVKTIRQHQTEIDETITKTAISYEFERIQSVERNILRLGTYEILFDSSIPPVVAITEAVRLAKKFGTPESAAFVNAILDAIYKASQGEQIDAEILVKQAETLKMSEQVATDLQNEPPQTTGQQEETPQK